jgi:hypothetical protein
MKYRWAVMSVDRQLLDYLPEVLQEILEYQLINLDAEQPEMELAYRGKGIVLDNQFLDTMHLEGVTRWETILQLVPRASDTLSDRKSKIQARINTLLPFTMRRLDELLRALCGEGNYSIDLDHNNYTLIVSVTVGSRNLLSDVGTLTRHIVPANLALEIAIQFNTWGIIKEFTWGALAPYTWQDVLERDDF